MFDRPPLMTKRRTLLAFLGVGLFDMTLMGRLVKVQGFDGPHLRKLADDIHFRKIPLAARRGDILDRSGRLLAGSHHVFSLYAVPAKTAGRRQMEALILSQALKVPEDRMMRRLSRRHGFVWLKRHLTGAEVDQLRAQLPLLPGVFLLTEYARYYPDGFLAGPVIGFTGIDNQGLSGLELAYNRVLTGRRGTLEEEYDALGKPLPKSDQRIIPARPGDSVRLTLDEKIQWMAETAAEHALRQTGAKSVSITVVEPRTGGILALAQRPSLDPARFRDFEPKRARIYAVSDAIPPGSIFKPLTLAAALEAGAARPSSGYFCPGFKIVLGRRVNCWRPAGHGGENLGDVVKNSCNVGFMDLGLALGIDRFYEWMDRFQVHGLSHVDLPGEARGILPAKGRATLLDLAVMAFGQTLTVTPINLLNSIAAIANGGELMVPHLADAILAPDGRVIRRMHADPVRRVVSPEVSRIVQRMMSRVVSQGTGKQAEVPGYRVAGKTGTAEKVIGGRVVKGVYIASFVGFAPVPDPKVAIMVNIDEPKGAFYGGQVAAPVFGRLMRQILRYLKIPPNQPIRRPRPNELAMVPDLVDLDPDQAEKDATISGFPVQFNGTGEVVVGQSIEYGGWRRVGTVVGLTLGHRYRTYLEWVTVPDFSRLDLSRAHTLAFTLGLNVRAVGGNGPILGQSPPPGTQVKGGTTVLVDTG